MSERLADDLDVHACRQHECGGGIAQIVESAGVLPAFSPLLAVAFLTEPVGLEDLEGLVVQGDETDAKSVLGAPSWIFHPSWTIWVAMARACAAADRWSATAELAVEKG
ncbi:hypothetical protein [Streptomyces yokosukanensis]|uniref:hypothetical protein n=1 Tax=Streptomyces yokosukanensis TaxID=67386 RepID=UPI003F4CB9CE